MTRDQTLPAPVSDAQAIRRAAGECLKRVDLTRRIRLLGVRVGTLEKQDDTAGGTELGDAGVGRRPRAGFEAMF